jgi:hypothetical protein
MHILQLPRRSHFRRENRHKTDNAGSGSEDYRLQQIDGQPPYGQLCAQKDSRMDETGTSKGRDA